MYIPLSCKDSQFLYPARYELDFCRKKYRKIGDCVSSLNHTHSVVVEHFLSNTSRGQYWEAISYDKLFVAGKIFQGLFFPRVYPWPIKSIEKAGAQIIPRNTISMGKPYK